SRCWPPDVIVSPYNIVLTLDQLINKADQVYCVDQETFDSLCYRMHVTLSAYAARNKLIGSIAAEVTSNWRFATDDSSNSTMQKVATNLTPFPRLHFFSITHEP